MKLVTQFGPVLGRSLIAVIFLVFGISKIGAFSYYAGYMASKGLPMVPLLLVLTIVIEIGGALMLILGWKARWAAAVLFLWMIPVTLTFHRFWSLPPDQQEVNMIMFFKNISMMGAMVYVMAFGSGPLSLDRDGG